MLACGVLTAAAVASTLNVNFNSCTGQTATTDSSCGLSGKALIRYVETEFPPWDSLDAVTHRAAGFNKELFDIMCKTKLFTDHKIGCIEIRDKWANVWSADHYPGMGIQSGWYHFAFAFVNSLRANSMVYTTPIAKRLKNVFAYRQAVNGDPTYSAATFPSTGRNLTVCLAEGYGDNNQVKATFPEATYVTVADYREQLMAINPTHDTTKVAVSCNVAWVSHQQIAQFETEYPDQQGIQKFEHSELGKELPFDDKHRDEMAFMLMAHNTCVRDLINAALAELATSAEVTALFQKYAVLTGLSLQATWAGTPQ